MTIALFSAHKPWPFDLMAYLALGQVCSHGITFSTIYLLARGIMVKGILLIILDEYLKLRNTDLTVDLMYLQKAAIP